MPQQLALQSFPAWCGARGITAIELIDNQLPSLERAYLTELVRAAEHAGVSIACLAITNDFTILDADSRFAQVERVRHLLYDVAVPLRAPMMRVFMGMSDTSEESDQRVLETFRGMVTDLETTGVTMVLENFRRTSTSAEQLAAIVAGVNSPFFGCCLNFAMEPADQRYDSLFTLAPLARYAHATSYAFNEQGEETTIDYRRIIAILAEHAYDGIISIEYEGTGDPYEGILQTKTLLERLWNTTGRMAA